MSDATFKVPSRLRMDHTRRISDTKHTHEARSSRGIRHTLKFLEKPRIVGSISFRACHAKTGVSRTMHTRRATERIHLKTRIVGEHHGTQCTGVRDGLDARIFFKRCTIFHRLRDVGATKRSASHPELSENGRNLVYLVRVRCGDDKFLHVSTSVALPKRKALTGYRAEDRYERNGRR